MKRIIIYLLAALAAVLLLIALNAQMRRTAAAELALTEGTLAAVAEASSELEHLTLTMDKLLVTTSQRQSITLLAQIALSADRVQTSLSALPDTQGQRAATLTYLSRLSHLCQTWLADLTEKEGLSADARATLTDMLGGIRLLQSEFVLAQQEVLVGGKVSALPPSDLTAPPTAQELSAYRALPSTEVSAGEAMQLAKEFVGVERVKSVSHAPDTAGALPAYGVTVQTEDVQLNLEVTRRGGKVLLMSPETAAFPVRKSTEACTSAALAFLQTHGFATMEAVWQQMYDGLLVLTCAYVQEDVLVWSDRVVVQVRMDTAEVVGLEARSYWKNHIPRKLPVPLLTQEEARSALSPEGSVIASRLCLLPHDGQERMCWQFTLTVRGDTYISYVDAITGTELLLEKVIPLDEGSMAA